MNKSTKMVIIVAIIIVIAILIIGITTKPKNNNKSGKLNIVATTFSTYDFSKQIVGDNAEVTFLLGPGVDAHSYDPSSADIIKIQNADVLIYIGGDMEKWMDKLLEANLINSNKTTLIKVTESVETIEEKEVDGAEEEKHHHGEGKEEEHHQGENEDKEEEHHHEKSAFDEHIWSSPKNAIKMVKYLSNKFSEIDENNKEIYNKNAEEYIEKIKNVQAKVQEIVDNKKRDRLIFGDKMPMQYFLEEYGLTASAAFNGCSTDTDPSAKTITYLIKKVKEENIPVVLYIELSTGKTAKAIAQETGAKTMQIQTLHNVSKEDFEKGETYVSLMTRNVEVLKQALQ